MAGQDQEVQDPVQRDQPQHVAIPERAAAQRHGHVLPAWRELFGRLVGRAQYQPGIAAQAPVPAHAVRVASEQAVLAAQRGGIGAEQLVPVQPAADQLIAQLGEVAPELLRAGRRHRPGRRFASHRSASPQ